MEWLLKDFALLSVLLRAAVLATEAVVVGAIGFRIFVLRNAQGQPLRSWQRLLRLGAIALALAELAGIAVSAVELKGSSGMDWHIVFGAGFVKSGLLCSALAAAIWWMAGLRRAWLLSVPAALVVACVVSDSHAAAQLDHAVLAMAGTIAHHLGTALWVGAMPFLLLALPRAASLESARSFVARYSNMALVAVALLLGGGIAMSLLYIGSWQGLYGTAYGLMVIAKAVLFCVMLALGAGNFYLVRRIHSAPALLLKRLARFTEVELGLGFTVILAAASLTSQPPARDLVQDRLTGHELAQRFTPVVPRLKSPPISSLTPATDLHTALQASVRGDIPKPNAQGDIEWSEYNHHWAGLIVLLAGALALLSRTGWPGTRWARHWPLAFIALGIFIVLRADPENWPLGPNSFWASFYDAENTQHRLAALLVVAFAWFEWRVQNGRVTKPWVRLVFPTICALGAALLLTHNHALGNVKEELLAEYSHTPIALAGALAGWGRWLELRLPPDTEDNRKAIRWAGYLWPACLMLAGLILLNYREA